MFADSLSSVPTGPDAPPSGPLKHRTTAHRALDPTTSLLTKTPLLPFHASRNLEPSFDRNTDPNPRNLLRGIAFLALLLLLLALVGLATRTPALSAIGIFLYVLIGFGSAPLILCGLDQFDILAFSAPAGVAGALLIGTLLVEFPLWGLGPVLFWTLAIATAIVHLSVLSRPWLNPPARVPLERAPGPPVAARNNRKPRGGHFRYQRLRLHLRPVHAHFVMTGLGLFLCLASAFAISPLDPGPTGLLGAISPAWYAGLGLLAIAVVLGQRLPHGNPGIPVIALQLSLTLTPAIAYIEPRYPWTMKHVGVTAYILLHGSVNATVDIYQAWPGLFAAVAWLCRVSTLANPLAVAKWWPPVIDLATLLVFRQFAATLLRDSKRAWLAGALFVLGNTIGQDYFSPQATAYLLAIATFGVVFRHRHDNLRMSFTRWLALGVLAVATALTHQLTPYMVTGALVILTLFGYTRSRFSPALTLAPALGWALLHFSYVKQYLNPNQFGDLAQNLLTPGLAGPAVPPGALITLNRYFLAGGSLLLGILALSVIVSDRRALSVALALAATSGAGLLVLSAYGNEGDFRIVLFALPWLAILAAVSDRALHLAGTWLWALVIPALLAAYVVSDMGLDYINVVRPGDLVAVQNFENSSPPGSTLIAIANQYVPFHSSPRYNLTYEDEFPLTLRPNGPNIRQIFRDFSDQFPADKRKSSPPVYVLFAQQPASNLAIHSFVTVSEYWSFASEFAHSSSWRIIIKTHTAELFRLQYT